jgi:hypothetical protein
MIDVKTPILIFKKGHKNLYAYEFAFMANKSLVSFYKDTTLVDSIGGIFEIESAARKGGIKLLQSLKSLSLMVEVDPKIKSVGKITLDELKDRIFAHVSSNAKHWLVLDTLDGMRERIYSARSFEELIRIFR